MCIIFNTYLFVWYYYTKKLVAYVPMFQTIFHETCVGTCKPQWVAGCDVQWRNASSLPETNIQNNKTLNTRPYKYKNYKHVLRATFYIAPNIMLARILWTKDQDQKSAIKNAVIHTDQECC